MDKQIITIQNVRVYLDAQGRLGLYELLKQNGYLPTIEQAA